MKSRILSLITICSLVLIQFGCKDSNSDPIKSSGVNTDPVKTVRSKPTKELLPGKWDVVITIPGMTEEEQEKMAKLFGAMKLSITFASDGTYLIEGEEGKWDIIQEDGDDVAISTTVAVVDDESMNATFISDDEFHVKDDKGKVFVFSKAKPGDTKADEKKADEKKADDSKAKKDK